MNSRIVKFFFLITALIIFFIPKYEFATNNIMLGDINQDKIIDQKDLLIMLRHVAATENNSHSEWILKDTEFKIADINEDEIINAKDLLVLLRYTVAKNSQDKIAKKHPEWLELEKKSFNTNVNNNTNVNTNTNINTNTNANTNTNTDTNTNTNTNNNKLESAVKVKSIALSKTNVTLDLSGIKTITLKATIEPKNATNKTVTWTSSNTKVATVDNNGKVIARANGTTVITAKSKSDISKNSTCKVAVITTPTGIVIKKTSVTIDLTKSEKVTLVATVLPKTASYKDIIWKSSNTKVATVDNNGKVKAKKIGTVNITATLKNNSSIKKKAKITIKAFDKKHATKVHYGQFNWNNYGNGNWGTCGPTVMAMAIDVVTNKDYSQLDYYKERSNAKLWNGGSCNWCGNDASPDFNKFHKSKYGVKTVKINRTLKDIRKVLDAGGVVWAGSENKTKSGKILSPWLKSDGTKENYQHEGWHQAIIWRHYTKNGKEYFIMKHSGVNNGKYTAKQMQNWLDSCYGEHGGNNPRLRNAVYGVFNAKNKKLDDFK